MTVCDFCGKSANKKIVLPTKEKMQVKNNGQKVGIFDTGKILFREYDVCERCLGRISDIVEFLSSENHKGESK